MGDTMIRISSFTVATAVAALLLAGSASAQTTAPAAPAAQTAPAPKAKPMAKPKAERSAVSLECSKQADAKGLHGKERKKFRASCKKSGGKAN
jgi:hypothetical protein